MEIKLIQTQKVLSPTQINLASHVINPYRGCEFGCLYCYSQENKNIKNFSEKLGVKINAPQVLERELRYKTPKRVLLGSTTECFQYQELKFKVTEKILNILNNSYNIPYTLLTKSHLVSQYLPLIKKSKRNKIYFTLNFSSDDLITLLEQKSPNVQSRIQTIKEIIAQSIPLRVHIGPFIPYISLLEEIIALLPKGVCEINVELYHHTMGNYKEILNRIEKKFGSELKSKMESVYFSEENYAKFAKELKEEIDKIANKGSIKFFYIVPEFNAFYTPNIDYEDSL